MDNNAKLRPLYLAKILYEMTDEERTLSTNQLIKLLKEKYNIDSYRTTIASDIELLKKYGLDIQSTKSQSIMYNMISREFDLPELKLLIDAVASSKFITDKKSKEPVAKLAKLASNSQADELKRNIIPEGRIKAGNENIYYIVDAVNTAINNKKQISFQYFCYNVRKQKAAKHDGEVYVFSPYYLIWNGDYYYAVGYSEKHGGIGSFRLDRIIKQPTLLEVDAVPMPADFSISRYINTSFRMYNSRTKTVELICDNCVMDAIIDRFGESVQTYANDMETFRAVVDVAVNHVFFGWLFGFEGKVKIKSPDDVKEKYRKMIDAAKNCIE